MTKVFEAAADALAREADTVFALMGDGNLSCLSALHRLPSVRVFDVRHEGAAVAMADGYSRATGRVGVCTVTCGPGLTQVGTSLMAASRHGSSLVVLAGDTPAVQKNGFALQDMDQRAFAEASGADFQPIRSPETALDDIASAFRAARRRRRPVVLNAPIDIQEAELGPGDAYRASAAEDVRPVAPLDTDLSALLRALAIARSPVILAGLGAVTSCPPAEAQRLADVLGAMTATTLPAKSYFAELSGHLGIAGGFAHAEAEAAFAEADLVLALGSSLNAFTTRNGRLFPAARVKAVTTGPLSAEGIEPARLARISADVGITVALLLAGLAERRHVPSAFRTARLIRPANEVWQDDMVEFPDEAGAEPVGLDPRRALSEIDAHLGDSARVLIGAGHFQFFPTVYLSSRQRTFSFAHAFGAIGQALATAIGMATTTGPPVVAFEGDASLMMHVQELETLGRYQLPLLVFVMNDGALGAEMHRLGARGFDPALAAVGRPDFAAVARAFGVRGETIDRLAQLRPLLADFTRRPRPVLADIRLSTAVVSRPFRRSYF